MLSKKEIGIKGEHLAVQFIQENGLKLLEKNWRCEIAEADIIAMDGDVLVVIEVKTRTSERYGAPEEAVNDRKQEKMIEAAEMYLNEKNLENEVRFDIIAVILNSSGHTINYIQSAF